MPFVLKAVAINLTRSFISLIDLKEGKKTEQNKTFVKTLGILYQMLT